MTDFKEVFPTFESATIASYESGEGVDRFGPRRQTFGPPQRFVPDSGRIPCSNPRCLRGGYDVAGSLYEMVRHGLTEKEFSKLCPGDEGSPKGRRKWKRCLNVLFYRLAVKYKPETPALE